MGRYRQARNRGRGADCGTTFTLPAPVLDTDWAIENGGGSVFGDFILLEFPTGADGIEFEVWLDPDGIHNIVVWIANPQTLIAEQDDGTLVDVRARWTLAGVAVSDWSDTTQVSVVNE